ncbi:MAG: amidohydrolase [Gemmatimonadales bacterium]|jgi:predicted amidohydrolase YtcJ
MDIRPVAASHTAALTRRVATALLVGTFLVACSESSGEPADLILRGGHIITMDPGQPRAEALAVSGDRLVYVGDEAGVESWRGPETRVVDLDGATALPGLTDGHAHLMGTGRLEARVDLLGTTSYAQVLEAVTAAVERAKPGEWILGRGWHQEKWSDDPEVTVRGFPTNADLNRIAPDNPVSIRHASGHGRLVNQRALEAAGITADTPNPPGGEILHLPDGRPSGMLIENAEDLVENAYQEQLASQDPATRRAAEHRALQAGIDEFLRNGVTEVHSPPSESVPGASLEEIALYREARDAGELRMRVWAMVGNADATDGSLDSLWTIGTAGGGEGRLTVRAIKAYADGALGSRGAMLLEPYADDDSQGEEVSSRAELERVAELALEHGWQAGVHAIGDAANRRVLDVYEQAFARHPEAAEDARFRIEHAQILAPADVPRFAELGVTAAMQGVQATSDGPWTPTRLGAARSRERAYAFRDLWEAGALIIGGTDSPVERVNPWASMAGMAIGRMANGEVFNPGHLLTRREALETYTINAAKAAFEENERGSLEVGKLADVTVVDGDPLTVPDADFASLGTLMTIVGGVVEYEAPAPDADLAD